MVRSASPRPSTSHPRAHRHQDCSSPAPGPAPTRGIPTSPAPGRSTDAGTDLLSGVLVGSQCRITEDEPGQAPSSDPSYTWAGHTVDPASVTVGADSAPARLTVTNHTIRQLTPLRISKILVGDQAGEPAGKPYDMSYSCIDGSGVTHTGSNSIDSGESWTTDRVIPLGSTCTVTEGDLPDVSPRDTWGPVHLRHHPRRRRSNPPRPRNRMPRTRQAQSAVVRGAGRRGQRDRARRRHQPADPGAGRLSGRQDRPTRRPAPPSSPATR